ncbi:MAG TPA: GcrA family cell cycle regulator [Candidatus Binatia bacterium]|nr:GcrA family cell cycle regulator [Candidatus Binatia bacterium]
MAAWTDIEKQKLRKLAAEGQTPVRMVDHFPGRTRNAIVGQMHRMGLQCREEWMRQRANNPETDLIVRLRCKPWGWDDHSIAQAIGQDVRTVRKVIETHTEFAA